VPTAISLHFTTNESFDIGSDTNSPVSLAYFDQAPFAFNGTIGTTTVAYPKK
jgi:arylsulfatase